VSVGSIALLKNYELTIDPSKYRSLSSQRKSHLLLDVEPECLHCRGTGYLRVLDWKGTTQPVVLGIPNCEGTGCYEYHTAKELEACGHPTSEELDNAFMLMEGTNWL
jgi:hypothetical protein